MFFISRKECFPKLYNMLVYVNILILNKTYLIIKRIHFYKLLIITLKQKQYFSIELNLHFINYNN